MQQATQMLTSVILMAFSSSVFSAPVVNSPQQQFFAALKAYCGQAFVGKVIKGNASDQDFMTQTLLMHVRECSDTELKIPFHIGENRSRTWIIRKTAAGLELKHDHRHEDGTEDAITMYGGTTSEPGSATLQQFPADEHSKTMFKANHMLAAMGNTWSIELLPAKSYRYALKRAGREFIVEFDLTKPVTPPPAPWGHQ